MDESNTCGYMVFTQCPHTFLGKKYPIEFELWSMQLLRCSTRVEYCSVGICCSNHTAHQQNNGIMSLLSHYWLCFTEKPSDIEMEAHIFSLDESNWMIDAAKWPEVAFLTSSYLTLLFSFPHLMMKSAHSSFQAWYRLCFQLDSSSSQHLFSPERGAWSFPTSKTVS